MKITLKKLQKALCCTGKFPCESPNGPEKKVYSNNLRSNESEIFTADNDIIISPLLPSNGSEDIYAPIAPVQPTAVDRVYSQFSLAPTEGSDDVFDTGP